MMYRSLGVIYLLTFLFYSSCQSAWEQESEKRPNIIYILADDLGYGELGVYGQEKIETPHIDKLARGGMLFTQHYTGAPVCAPARYMLLTGQHSGHAYIRGNDEWNERGDVWDYRKVAKDWTLEGQRPIPDTTRLLPAMLKSVGYNTAMIGKWGLGAPHSNSIPTKMGFDFFCGYNCQRQAHTYYPLHLYLNEDRIHLSNDTVPPGTKLLKGADPSLIENYKPFQQVDYAPDIMFRELMSFVKKQKEQPFFLYWATPIPHNPIQAPSNWVKYYQEKFGPEQPYLGEKGYFPHHSPHAGYAAMISYLDEKVGELVAYLKEEDLFDNTIIMFSSDNGVTYSGGTDGPFFNSSGPFGEEYGRGKGFVYEGGIRVPFIVSWPNHIKANTQSDHVSTHYDVVATLSELTGFEMPAAGSDGVSLLSTLLGRSEQQDEHEYLYWEFPEYGGQIAIRIGEHKIIKRNLNKPDVDTPVELYNLLTDPAEQINKAEQHPDLIQKATEIIRKEHTEPQVERFQQKSIEL